MAEPTTADPGVTARGAGPAHLRRSPLAHLADRMRAAEVTGARGVRLTEVPFTTMVTLRVAPSSAAAGRVASALGAPLPPHCGATARSGPLTVLWLGPDEWLVTAPDGAPGPDPAALLSAALGCDPGSVVDVSANRTVLELRGPSAREVLEQWCALDLHPRSFGPGTAVPTLVGPIQAVVWQIDDVPSYRLLPRSSFADHLARLLIDAMDEYRVPEVP